jgi:hypothetical protein
MATLSAFFITMKQKILQAYFKLLGALARQYIKKTNPYIIGIN